MLEFVDIIISHKWVPDLIIFQYVFSDMYKNSTKGEMEIFIEKLSKFLNEQTDKTIYILVNDTNLSTMYKGGREFFDILNEKIQSPKSFGRKHFKNANKGTHYEYGDEYRCNRLIFDDISEEIQRIYSPFDSCASAQVLIKKIKEDDEI